MKACIAAALSVALATLSSGSVSAQAPLAVKKQGDTIRWVVVPAVSHRVDLAEGREHRVDEMRRHHGQIFRRIISVCHMRCE